MNMHHVGPELLEKVHEVWHDAVAVDLAEIEAVEMPAPHDHLIGRIAYGLEASARTLLAMQVVRRRQEQSFHIWPRAKLPKQVVREDFRSPRVEIRMVVSNDEHAHGQAIASGLVATITS